jgi:hypothetical protein
MQAFGRSRKDGTFFSASFVTDGNHIGKELSGLKHIEHLLCFLARDIDSHLCHCFYCERVKRPWFQPGALGLKVIAAGVVQPSLSHLAAGAVMDADEEDLFFHGESGYSSGIRRQSYNYVTIRATSGTTDKHRYCFWWTATCA